MSYPYEFDYEQDSSVAGYSGPSVIVISDGNNMPGIVNPSDNRLLIRTSVERILGTRKRSRVMRPEFGSSLMSMLFEQLDSMTTEDIQNEIIDVLNREEPRIIVQMVNVEVDYDRHCIQCTIQFRYKNTGRDDSFAFSII